MIPFGLAPAALRRGLQIMKGGLEKLNDQLTGPSTGIPQTSAAQATRDTTNIRTPFDYQPDPFAEKANALRRQLAGPAGLESSGYMTGDGNSGNGFRYSNSYSGMEGSYSVTKETIQDQTGTYPGTNRPKYGPATSDISFGHDVNQMQPYPKNPHARGTTQFADFEYKQRLENAGLRYMLGRQIDGIKVGNYLTGNPISVSRARAYRANTGGALQFPDARIGNIAGFLGKARRVGTNTWQPVQFSSHPERPVPLTGGKVNKYGFVTFDPKSLKTALKEMGKEIVTYKLTNNTLRPGRMRLPGWAQVYMEAEQFYRGVTTNEQNPQGRSLTKDTLQKAKDTLNPYTEQVGKNKFLPSGLAF